MGKARKMLNKETAKDNVVLSEQGSTKYELFVSLFSLLHANTFTLKHELTHLRLHRLHFTCILHFSYVTCYQHIRQQINLNNKLQRHQQI